MNTTNLREERSPPDADWWRGAVLYQVYPRSFADHNGDGVGDLPGILDRLGYLAGLGVDAVWISPFFKSPMKDFGYDVEDYRAVDPLFGTLDDFDRLVERAHALGLKVLIDQVVSHTADTHAWFQESRSSRDSPCADWYVWADAQPDGSPPNNWLSVFGGSSWQWDTRRRQFYLHNFLAAQPDLNFHNPTVRAAVLDDIRFWLDRGVDGFRFDTTNYYFHDLALRPNAALRPDAPDAVAYAHNPYDMQVHAHDKNRPENVQFLEEVRALLNQYGATSVGEVGDADALATMLDYTAGNQRLHMTYSFSMLSPDASVAHLRKQVEQFEAAAAEPGQGGWACWTIGNHDADRVLTRWKGTESPQSFVRVMLTMLVSLRGSVCWYQGDELALEQADLPFEALVDPPGIAFWPEYKGRDGCRTPIPWEADAPHAGFSGGQDVTPWLPVPDAHRRLAVDASEADPNAPLHYLRSLLPWRHSFPALVKGGIRFLDAPEPVMALVREAPARNLGPSLLVVLNLGTAPVQVTLDDAPASVPMTVPGLPDAQRARRTGHQFSLPAHGIYFGALEGAPHG
jgi:alpha-glucosidase